MLKTPAIVVNLKTYLETTGKKALELAKVMERVSSETGVQMAICPQAADLRLVAENSNVPVFAQHFDVLKPGAGTGMTLPETVADAGACGTLVNHSEHRLTLADIDWCVQKAKALKLDTIVCTNNVATSAAAAALKPYMVAVEPPELIGGDISVTSADPAVVSGSVDAVRKVDEKVLVLCGAGVKNGKDVRGAIELGSAGVLLASGVAKAKNWEEVLMDLAKGAVE